MPGWKQRIKQSATEMLKLPPDALLDTPRVTCLDGKSVVVDNAKSLVKVEESIVLLDCDVYTVVIRGHDFEVTLVTDKEVHVTGLVDSLEFQRNGRDAP